MTTPTPPKEQPDQKPTAESVARIPQDFEAHARRCFEESVHESPWAIWSPEMGCWGHFPADLAAKYSSQGCLVRLVESAQELESLAVPTRECKELLPDEPPYSPREIVWNERASRYKPEWYGAGWRKIKRWVKAETGRNPDDVVEEYQGELGEWGGASNLEEINEESRRFLEELPLFDEPIPF